MSIKSPSYTKKGPGRRHQEGDGAQRREYNLAGNKLARQASRGHAGLRHK